MGKQGKVITFDVAITNDLQLGFFARGDATAQDGKIALEYLIKLLETTEITVSGFSEIEKHADDPRIQQVHDLTHEHDH